MKKSKFMGRQVLYARKRVEAGPYLSEIYRERLSLAANFW
jgi:hypothetical protein